LKAIRLVRANFAQWDILSGLEIAVARAVDESVFYAILRVTFGRIRASREAPAFPLGFFFRESGFDKRTQEDFSETIIYPEMSGPCFFRDNTPVCDLELGRPRHQLNLGSPQRSDEYQPLFGSRTAPALSEAEQPSPDNFRASLFQHFSIKRLQPGLLVLRAATGQTPAFRRRYRSKRGRRQL
jgi:hypothetical protein